MKQNEKEKKGGNESGVLCGDEHHLGRGEFGETEWGFMDEEGNSSRNELTGGKGPAHNEWQTGGTGYQALTAFQGNKDSSWVAKSSDPKDVRSCSPLRGNVKKRPPRKKGRG